MSSFIKSERPPSIAKWLKRAISSRLRPTHSRVQQAIYGLLSTGVELFWDRILKSQNEEKHNGQRSYITKTTIRMKTNETPRVFSLIYLSRKLHCTIRQCNSSSQTVIRHNIITHEKYKETSFAGSFHNVDECKLD